MLHKHPAHIKHVALAFPVAFAHMHGVTRGVTAFAQSHGTWRFTTSAESPTLPVTSLRGWHGHGAIALLDTRAKADAAAKLGFPVVNISSALPGDLFPRVRNDNAAVGTMAAKQLLSCGFRRFALYGLRGVAYSAERGDAFIAEVQQAGFPCNILHSPSTLSAARPWQDEMGTLEKWIRQLTPPVGIFAVNDQRARMAIDACLLAGLRVPHDAGLLGCDNNQVICEFNDPQLSSIACDAYRLGFEAATLLDKLMRGLTVPHHDLLIPPIRVVTRQSTDVIVVENPAVARAVEFIRAHLTEPFGIKALLAAAGVSRRHLEMCFKKFMGCSPNAFLQHARVARAKELLQSKDRLSLSRIATSCGFGDPRRLRIVFTRVESMTPAQFRKRAQSA